MELTFADASGGTLVTVSHSRFVSDVECDLHVDGWEDTFARLAVWLPQ